MRENKTYNQRLLQEILQKLPSKDLLPEVQIYITIFEFNFLLYQSKIKNGLHTDCSQLPYSILLIVSKIFEDILVNEATSAVDKSNITICQIFLKEKQWNI